MDQRSDNLHSRRKMGYYHVQQDSCESSSSTPKQQETRKQEPTLLVKLHNIATSLPVTISMMAFLMSQGIGLNGAFWYINYLALTTILLTGFALILNQISTFASHSFCETVFISISTPISAVFDINVNLQCEETKNGAATTISVSSWLIHGSLISCLVADTAGFSFYSIAYVVVISSAYQIIAISFSKMAKCDRNDPQNTDILAPLSVCVIIYDIYVSPIKGLSNAINFFISNSSIRDISKVLVQKLALESLEGLEVYYVDGIFELAQMVATIVALFYHFCFAPHLFVAIYLCFYNPILKFKTSFQCIKSESLCLSNFNMATTAQIKDYDDVCAICLSHMSYARITPCNHIFHGKCLKNCLQKKAQCPLCNAQIL